MRKLPVVAFAAAIAVAATACKGRTMENVQPTGDTVEVTPLEPAEATPDVMNHDAEAVTLPDSIEVPE